MLVGMLHHPFNYTEVSTVLIRTWSKCKCTASDVFIFNEAELHCDRMGKFIVII